MNESQAYRNAFSRVKAPADTARRVLARAAAGEERPQKEKLRRFPRRAAAVVALAAVLAVSVLAEASEGAVSNLLAPLFGAAQTALVDNIGYPVGASATVDGYTLTADAVIGDSKTMYTVYTLRRDDGKPLPKIVRFRSDDNSLLRGHSSFSSMSFDDVSEDGAVRFVTQWSGNVPLIGRNVTVSFTDLYAYDEASGTVTTLAKGTWELRYTLRCRDTSREVPGAKGVTVTDAAGRVFTVEKLTLSALTARVDMTLPPYTEREQAPDMEDFTLTLRLRNGTELKMRGMEMACAASGTACYTANFAVPCPAGDAASVVLCGVEIPVR